MTDEEKYMTDDHDCGTPGCEGFHYPIKWLDDEGLEILKGKMESYLPGEENYAEVAEPVTSLAAYGDHVSMNGLVAFSAEALTNYMVGTALLLAGHEPEARDILTRTLRSVYADSSILSSVAMTILQHAAKTQQHLDEFSVAMGTEAETLQAIAESQDGDERQSPGSPSDPSMN